MDKHPSLASIPSGPADTQEISAALGKELYETMGCMACHSNDGSTEGRVGPTLAGLAGNSRSFAKGKDALADADYLRESILQPSVKVLKAYAESDIGMPTYEGVLTQSQVNSLVEYIRTLE